MDRRKLITGLSALIATPAIVRASSLMPIKGERYFTWTYTCPILPNIEWFGGPGIEPRQDLIDACLGPNGRLYIGTWTFFGKSRNVYSDQVISFHKTEGHR